MGFLSYSNIVLNTPATTLCSLCINFSSSSSSSYSSKDIPAKIISVIIVAFQNIFHSKIYQNNICEICYQRFQRDQNLRCIGEDTRCHGTYWEKRIKKWLFIKKKKKELNLTHSGYARFLGLGLSRPTATATLVFPV